MRFRPVLLLAATFLALSFTLPAGAQHCDALCWDPQANCDNGCYVCPGGGYDCYPPDVEWTSCYCYRGDCPPLCNRPALRVAQPVHFVDMWWRSNASLFASLGEVKSAPCRRASAPQSVMRKRVAQGT